MGWLPVQDHSGSEVGGSKWLKVVTSGSRNACPAVEVPIQRKSGVQMWADSLVQHHLGSEVGGSKWLKVVKSGSRNVCPAVEDPIQRKSGV